FINPGSCGRMFDGNPIASYALLEIVGDTIRVDLRRIAYSIEKTMAGLKKSGLPEIYCEMYRLGRKLN
ncbi:MAG: metallophosphoesterase, partial [Thermodesulfobacteriota bacterium]